VFVSVSTTSIVPLKLLAIYALLLALANALVGTMASTAWAQHC
jgi:hypothetical protein